MTKEHSRYTIGLKWLAPLSELLIDPFRGKRAASSYIVYGQGQRKIAATLPCTQRPTGPHRIHAQGPVIVGIKFDVDLNPENTDVWSDFGQICLQMKWRMAS